MLLLALCLDDAGVDGADLVVVVRVGPDPLLLRRREGVEVLLAGLGEGRAELQGLVLGLRLLAGAVGDVLLQVARLLEERQALGGGVGGLVGSLRTELGDVSLGLRVLHEGLALLLGQGVLLRRKVGAILHGLVCPEDLLRQLPELLHDPRHALAEALHDLRHRVAYTLEGSHRGGERLGVLLGGLEVLDDGVEDSGQQAHDGEHRGLPHNIHRGGGGADGSDHGSGPAAHLPEGVDDGAGIVSDVPLEDSDGGVHVLEAVVHCVDLRTEVCPRLLVRGLPPLGLQVREGVHEGVVGDRLGVHQLPLGVEGDVQPLRVGGELLHAAGGAVHGVLQRRLVLLQGLDGLLVLLRAYLRLLQAFLQELDVLLEVSDTLDGLPGVNSYDGYFIHGL